MNAHLNERRVYQLVNHDPNDTIYFLKTGYVLMSGETNDPVNPSHYKDLSIEPIDVIESWGLGFHEGNALKYIARAGRKGDMLEDLRKARWYLDRLIGSISKEDLSSEQSS